MLVVPFQSICNKFNISCTSPVDTKVNGGSSPSEVHKRERMQALTLDANLKRETLRASMLSEELVKQSLKKTRKTPNTHVCSYLALCERFKDQLVVKHSIIALGPETAVCFCETCVAGKPIVQIAGSPPQQYTLPVGWCQFIHRYEVHCIYIMHVDPLCCVHVLAIEDSFLIIRYCPVQANST